MSCAANILPQVLLLLVFCARGEPITVTAGNERVHITYPTSGYSLTIVQGWRREIVHPLPPSGEFLATRFRNGLAVTVTLFNCTQQQETNTQFACSETASATPKYFETFVEPPAIAAYVAYSAFILLTLIWAAVKFVAERSMKDQDEGRAWKTQPSGEDHEEIEQYGYSRNFIGIFLFVLTILLTLTLVGIFILLIIDYYTFSCSPPPCVHTVGVQCHQPVEDLRLSFSCSRRFFGSDILVSLIAVWHFGLVWLLAVVVMKDSMINFFRLRKPLSVATFVNVRKKKEIQNFTATKHDLLLVRWYVQAKASFTSTFNAQPMHSLTVPVQEGGEEGHRSRYIEFQLTRYVYDTQADLFRQNTEQFVGPTYGDMRQQLYGLSNRDVQYRETLLGKNVINIQVPTWGQSLAHEFLHFFYVYQFLSYVIWFWWAYWKLALIMAGILAISAMCSVFVHRYNANKLALLSKSDLQVLVFRNQQQQQIDAVDLVPGDLIEIPDNIVLPCDVVLTSGSTVMNESALTGESMPQQKVAMSADYDPALVYDPNGSGKKHSLFAGTQVMRSGNGRERAEGLVTTTGIATTKGQLISDIMYPKELIFKFSLHIEMFIIMLCCYALIAFGVTLYFKGQLTPRETAWLYGVFTVNQVISPLIPAVLVVGQQVAAIRLSNRDIHCLNPFRLTVCGKIRVMCFDKTGTITKTGLDFIGVQARNTTTGAFDPIARFAHMHETDDDDYSDDDVLPALQRANQSSRALKSILRGHTSTPGGFMGLIHDEMRMSLATCHSLTKLEGKLIGNQVEVNMFKATKYDLEERDTATLVVPPAGEGTHDAGLAIEKKFEFDHGTMSMSVIVRDLHTRRCFVFCKGSYEKIKDLSLPHTVPQNYDELSAKLSSQGYYVLAIGGRELDGFVGSENGQVYIPTEYQVAQLQRSEVEKDLVLYGFLLFRNELKDESTSAMLHLMDGAVRTVMITGDNARTGVYVARRCRMIGAEERVLLGDYSKEQQQMIWKILSSTGEEDCDTDWAQNRIQNASDKGLQDDSVAALTNDDRFQIALTGSAYTHLYQNSPKVFTKKYLLRTRVFARMRPADKVSCVEAHMAKGLITGMCGDGGNDCGALRVAHAGLALSDAEASIVSPFTCSAEKREITSVCDLLRYGRASLVTSFGAFKFLVLYGQSMSVNKLIQYGLVVLMGEWCWIYIDAFVVVGLSFALIWSQPADKLTTIRPTSALMGAQNLCSVFFQQAVNAIFSTVAILVLSSQSWFAPFDGSSLPSDNWALFGRNGESTTLFMVMAVQMITAAFTFSFGGAFRQTVFKNWILITFCVFLYGFIFIMLFMKDNSIAKLFELATDSRIVDPPPSEGPDPVPYGVFPMAYRWKLCVILIGNIITSIGVERFIVIGPIAELIRKLRPTGKVPLQITPPYPLPQLSPPRSQHQQPRSATMMSTDPKTVTYAPSFTTQPQHSYPQQQPCSSTTSIPPQQSNIVADGDPYYDYVDHQHSQSPAPVLPLHEYGVETRGARLHNEKQHDADPPSPQPPPPRDEHSSPPTQTCIHLTPPEIPIHTPPSPTTPTTAPPSPPPDILETPIHSSDPPPPPYLCSQPTDSFSVDNPYNQHNSPPPLAPDVSTNSSSTLTPAVIQELSESYDALKNTIQEQMQDMQDTGFRRHAETLNLLSDRFARIQNYLGMNQYSDNRCIQDETKRIQHDISQLWSCHQASDIQMAELQHKLDNMQDTMANAFHALLHEIQNRSHSPPPQYQQQTPHPSALQYISYAPSTGNTSNTQTGVQKRPPSLQYDRVPPQVLGTNVNNGYYSQQYV